MTARIATCFAALLCFLATTSAQAATYRSDPKSSTLGFSSSYAGEAFSGRFGRFDANIVFDPANLAGARIEATVQLSSADTQNSERDDTLRGAEFFDAARMPTARYRATRLRSLGGNRYAADGVLTLRGATRPVTLTFLWKPGPTAGLIGEATVNRLDFGVGSGDWTDTKLIPNAVKVNATLVLQPGAGTAPAVRSARK